MATIVTPSRQVFYNEDVKYKKALSEALLRKIGSAINFIGDRIVDKYAINWGGNYRVQSTNLHAQPKIYIKTLSTVTWFTMSVGVRTSGADSINFKVYDEDGTYLGNLFSTAPSLAQNSMSNGLIGYDYSSDLQIKQITTSSFNNGTLNPAYENLLAGYSILPYLVSAGSDSQNLSLNIGITPQE